MLVTLCRVMAPLLPLLADHIYRSLTGEDSVHLTDWPDASVLPAERELEAAMDLVATSARPPPRCASARVAASACRCPP
ncbi:MAG: class I tRNA ligase family protein [Ilumatobacteraceae bacterium]